MKYFGQYEEEIYAVGLRGDVPKLPSATLLTSSSSIPRTTGESPKALSFAEAAGFKGIVVTLDTWVPGWRPRDLTALQLPAAARLLPR